MTLQMTSVTAGGGTVTTDFAVTSQPAQPSTTVHAPQEQQAPPVDTVQPDVPNYPPPPYSLQAGDGELLPGTGPGILLPRNIFL